MSQGKVTEFSVERLLEQTLNHLTRSSPTTKELNGDSPRVSLVSVHVKSYVSSHTVVANHQLITSLKKKKAHHKSKKSKITLNLKGREINSC